MVYAATARLSVVVYSSSRVICVDLA